MTRRPLLSAMLLALPATVSAQDLPGTYDRDNLLARTARGEVPAERLYEDAHVLALLADRPSARGHFIVISKRSRAANFLQIQPAELARIMAAAQRVARAEVTALGAQGFTLRQNNGSASSIAQFHLHVLPRWKGDTLPDGLQPSADPASLRATADAIRAALKR